MRRSLKKAKKLKKKLEEISTKVPIKGLVTTDLVAALKAADCDVLLQLAYYARGDVVSLGLMTKEELEEDAEFNDVGQVLKQSGRDRALFLIPPRIRAKALMELAPYIVPRKKDEMKEAGRQAAKVTFYIPENGRGVPDKDEEEDDK